MSDTVEQIKSRLDIVDVVSGYLKVQKAGVNWKARCPFHSEKTPSFYLSPERQSWHCFGCNIGGDMFSFVEKIEGVEFVEAMRILAQKAGVTIPERRSQDIGAAKEHARLATVTELAAKFFAKQLWHSNTGAKALAYLHERGLTDATIQAWQLGWAPNDWRALTGFLQQAGHADADIVAAGMAIQRQPEQGKRSTGIYDRFRSRIMFPISDTSGMVVGFAGRAFGAQVTVQGEAPAKYVNTPQTPLYDKSRTLFGLHLAKADIRKRDSCLLVEGNMDAILSWQAGATNVVATSGTALTPQQLRMVGRSTTNLDFCFDADQAGQTATRRGIGLALAQNFAVRILTIPDPSCKDPADYVAKHGEQWHEVVESAKPAMQYYYDRVAASLDPNSAASKKTAVASLGPLIKRLPSKVEQSHWIGALAMLLRTDQVAVAADVVSVKDDIAAYERGPESEPAPVGEQPVAQAPVDPWSQELLAVIVKVPELIPQASDAAALCDPRVAAIIHNPARLTSDDDPDRHLIDIAHIYAGEFYANFDSPKLATQLAAITARLTERDLKSRRTALLPLIAQAEVQHDQARRNELVGEFQNYTEELNRLRTVQLPPTA